MKRIKHLWEYLWEYLPEGEPAPGNMEAACEVLMIMPASDDHEC